jgi:hypothetical protein
MSPLVTRMVNAKNEGIGMLLLGSFATQQIAQEVSFRVEVQRVITPHAGARPAEVPEGGETMTTNTDQGIRDDPADQVGDSAKDRAKEEAGRLAETAKSEASEVVDVAKDQGKRLLADAQQRLTAEAGTQARRASESLRAMSSDFRTMAEAAQQGTASSWVRMGADGIESLADRLDSKGVEGVVQDVGGFARRNPTAFLALTFGAGLLVGRLVKNLDGEEFTQALNQPRQDQLSGSQTSAQIGAATS